MLARVRRVATALLLAAAALGACGGGDDDDQANPGGLAREAAAVVEDLEQAIEDGEFERICAELLSAEVRRQAGGGECPAMLARTSAGIERPSIEVKKIQIRGSVAVVAVTTTAKGQAPVDDEIRLVREDGRFRISSLSG
jgi:hypothetical protein